MNSRNNYFFRLLILFIILLEGCKYSLSYKEDFIDSSSDNPKTHLLTEVLMHLQLDYLNQEKLDPKILLRGALTELERAVPELWVTPQFNLEGNAQNVSVFFRKDTTFLPISKLDGLFELKNVLQRLLKLLLERNINLPKSKIENIFVRGILSKLDGYSVLLASEIYRDFNINIDGYFAGVGLVVGMRDGYLTVISPMDGSPAARAGLLPLDRIVAVDNEKTEYLTLEEILHRLRGNLGTTVKLSVYRKGNTNALNFVLVREEIKVESVEKFDFAFDEKFFRFIRIKNFQIGTSKEVKNKINNLEGVDGLILDLRNNPGGLLEEAVKISDLFLPGKQRIVSTLGPSFSNIHDSKKMFSGETLEKIPLAVLINKGSASASEIVAAALKQNKRAILIGEKSFGKGTVQTIWELKEGSGLKLTIGEYLTPSGNSIHNIGVSPSITLIPIYISKDMNNIEKGVTGNGKYLGEKRIRYLEAKKLVKNTQNLVSHKIIYLRNNSNTPKSHEISNEKYYNEKLKTDIFVRAAVRALQYWNSEKITYDFEKIFNEFEFVESRKIYKKLNDLGVDWSLSEFSTIPSPDEINFRWKLEKKTDGILSIKIEVHNDGNLEVNRLIAVTKASNVLLDGLELPLGKILPGEMVSQKVKLKYNSSIMDETESVEIILFDQYFNQLKSDRKKLNFSPQQNPSFRFSTKIYDNGEFGSKGNGDSKIQNRETISLRFKFVNEGVKILPEFLLKIRGSEGSFRINRGKIFMKNLAPGEEKIDYFLFKPMNNSKNLGKIKMEMIDTKSGNSRFVKSWNLNEDFSESEEMTPIINWLMLYDNEGNPLKGETNINSVILKGEIKNSTYLRDVFVHLNEEKVFYSANDKIDEKIDKNFLAKKEFRFSSKIKLINGANKISLFIRNYKGTIFERRIRISLRE